MANRKGWNFEKRTLELGDGEMDRLIRAADPCQFRISKTSYLYKVTIHAPGGGYAIREILHLNHIHQTAMQTDAVGYIEKLIYDMKKELGPSAMNPAPPVVKKEFTGIVQLAPKKQLECPEHHNLLVPAEEGVLKCPIEGCKRRMRKKVKEEPSSFAPDLHQAAIDQQTRDVLGAFSTVPAFVGDLSIPDDQVARKYAEFKGAQPSLVISDELSALASASFPLDQLGLSEEQKQKILAELKSTAQKNQVEEAPVTPATTDPYGGHDPYGGLRANERPVRVQYKNNRWYLLQQTDSGEVAIDVTRAYKKYESFHGTGSKENSFRLHLEW